MLRMGALPVLVAVAVSKDDVSGELPHDVLGSRVHEIERIDVVGLVEIMRFGESKGENKYGGRREKEDTHGNHGRRCGRQSMCLGGGSRPSQRT